MANHLRPRVQHKVATVPSASWRAVGPVWVDSCFFGTAAYWRVWLYDSRPEAGIPAAASLAALGAARRSLARELLLHRAHATVHKSFPGNVNHD